MNKEEFYYKVQWCPICKQGWIEIVKDIDTHKLFCCCCECENEWNHPSETKDKNKANKYEMYGRTCEPTEEEVAAIGWDKYIIKEW